MSEPLDQVPSDPGGLGPETRLTFAERYQVAAKAEGILAPVLTAVLAFFVGGLVVLITTGKNPIETYRAIFDGTGLNWLFPWVTGDERVVSRIDTALRDVNFSVDPDRKTLILSQIGSEDTDVGMFTLTRADAP